LLHRLPPGRLSLLALHLFGDAMPLSLALAVSMLRAGFPRHHQPHEHGCNCQESHLSSPNAYFSKPFSGILNPSSLAGFLPFFSGSTYGTRPELFEKTGGRRSGSGSSVFP
jgi:hypothetical protein